MLTRSPWLQQLPRAVVCSSAPSGYRWRQQPEPGCLSTLEAVAEALLVLEGARGPDLKTMLLAPFKKMVQLVSEHMPAQHDKNAELGTPIIADVPLRENIHPQWRRRRRRK